MPTKKCPSHSSCEAVMPLSTVPWKAEIQPGTIEFEAFLFLTDQLFFFFYKKVNNNKLNCCTLRVGLVKHY